MTPGGLAPLLRHSGLEPRVAVVLGSGLGDVSRAVTVAAEMDLDGALGLPAPDVAGHARSASVGVWGATPILVLSGRYHLYQGLTAAQVAAPVRAAAELGVSILILTNAAGGLDPVLQVGDLMLIRDHINLPGMAGASPLIPTSAAQPVEFISMGDAYSTRLRGLAIEAGREAGIDLREGIYAMVAGPSYETVAELRMLRLLGADAVGMSTAPEVVAARALGLDVLAISTITNRAVPDDGAAPSHAAVLQEGQRAADRLRRVLDGVLARLEPQV